MLNELRPLSVGMITATLAATANLFYAGGGGADRHEITVHELSGCKEKVFKAIHVSLIVLFGLKISRTCEYEADFIGLKLSTLAGYPAVGAVHAMRALDDDRAVFGADKWPSSTFKKLLDNISSFFSTHPRPSHRLTRLKREIEGTTTMRRPVPTLGDGTGGLGA